MSLPVLKTPTYSLTIPSSKKKIKYRPFLVQEEKILLLIKESEDTDEMINGMRDVIEACTFGKVDVDTLALFDVEYIFLQLRAKAVGEEIQIPMKCKNNIAEEDEPVKECGETIVFDIDLTKVKVYFPKKHTKNVIIEDNIGVTFKYPNVTAATNIESIEADPVKYVASLIESIFDADNVYDSAMVKKEEMEDWVNKLTRKQFEKIQVEFFESMPTMKHTMKYECSKCKKKGDYTFKGISDFF